MSGDTLSDVLRAVRLAEGSCWAPIAGESPRGWRHTPARAEGVPSRV